MALVPVRANQEIVGLLQLNDHRKGFFDLDLIHFLEEISDSVGVALIRLQDTQHLKESEERFRSIVEGAPEAVFVQTDLKFAYLNQAGLNLFGARSPSDLLGQHVMDRFPEEFRDQVQKRIRVLNEQKQSVPNLEQVYLRMDGSTVPVEVSAVPITYEGKNGALVFVRDISERKRAEVEIENKTKQLQHLLREKDKFFSIIAHDLKSPMSGLLSLSKMFADDVETLTIKDLRNVASAMYKSSERLFALMENLLQWAFMQQGVMEYSPRAHNLEGLIQAGIDPLISVSDQKQIALRSSIPDDLIVLADARMITTVIRNLVSNALKYSDSGGSVDIAAIPDQGMVRVSVQDSGMGMDQPTLDRVFALDRKASRPGTRGESGTGLGLVLCKEFVEKHGGRIWAQSEPGLGTTFYFTVPGHEGYQ